MGDFSSKMLKVKTDFLEIDSNAHHITRIDFFDDAKMKITREGGYPALKNVNLSTVDDIGELPGSPFGSIIPKYAEKKLVMEHLRETEETPPENEFGITIPFGQLKVMEDVDPDGYFKSVLRHPADDCDWRYTFPKGPFDFVEFTGKKMRLVTKKEKFSYDSYDSIYYGSPKLSSSIKFSMKEKHLVLKLRIQDGAVHTSIIPFSAIGLEKGKAKQPTPLPEAEKEDSIIEFLKSIECRPTNDRRLTALPESASAVSLTSVGITSSLLLLGGYLVYRCLRCNRRRKPLLPLYDGDEYGVD